MQGMHAPLLAIMFDSCQDEMKSPLAVSVASLLIKITLPHKFMGSGPCLDCELVESGPLSSFVSLVMSHFPLALGPLGGAAAFVFGLAVSCTPVVGGYINFQHSNSCCQVLIPPSAKHHCVMFGNMVLIAIDFHLPGHSVVTSLCVNRLEVTLVNFKLMIKSCTQ